MLDLAVIIVSWNTCALTLNALRTLYDDLEMTTLAAEVWVVDNASTDGSAAAIRAAFPAVHLLAQTENHGFAAGNNIALRELGFRDTPTPNPDGPSAVFLLNSDTRVQPGAMAALTDTLTTLPDTGLVGARLEYGDGSFQDGAFGFPGLSQLVIDLFPLSWLPRRVFGRLYNSRLNGRYPRALYDGGRAFPIGHPLGATMLLRRSAIEQTGLFDEQFYMYCEEVDWSMRIAAAGWRIYCQPRALVTHLSGQSTSQIRAQSLINLWRSRLRLYKKHYTPRQLRIARRLVRMGAAAQIRHAGTLPAAQRDPLITACRAIAEIARGES